jgi:predicted phage terminase large subunit-like protein
MTTLRPQPGPQTEFCASPASVVFYGGAAGGGKALKLDTPIATPTGWTTMGELRAGDFVYDLEGKPTRVEVAHPVQLNRPCYRVTFDDGSSIVADAEHLWVTHTEQERSRITKQDPARRAARRASRKSRSTGSRPDLAARNAGEQPLNPVQLGTRTTLQILDTLRVRGRVNHSVPLTSPLEGSQEFGLSPYLLGAWLGDGTTATGVITNDPNDSFIIDQIESEGWDTARSEANPLHVRIQGLTARLRALGLLGHKHIPPEALRAPYEYRLALLQGLMDTDGHANARGSFELSLTNREIIDGAHELLLSLGVKASICEGVAKLYGRATGPKYTIKFTSDLPCFRLPRKAAKHRNSVTDRAKRRYIVAVDPVESVPVRCIKVAAASGVFLAGRSMIPTHNTYALLLEALRYIQKRGYSAILFRKNFTQIKNAGGIWDTAVTLYSQIPGAVVRESALTIEWPKFGSKITFSHMQHEQDKFSHQGAQYPFIGWDEVPHFSREQFMYLFSRNRLGLCDPSVIPTIRATCNPEPGWVRDFLSPWVDSKYPHPARSGETRYFFVKDDRVQWVPPDELELTGDPLKDPKSCAFIRSTIHDNKELLRNDPSYLQQLNSLTAVQRQRLLLGNWDVEEGDKIFDRDWFRPLLPADLPPKFKRLVRYYDLAGTGELEKNGYRACWTAGVLLGLTLDGRIIVLDVKRFRKAPGEVQEAISKIAADDKANFGNVDIRVEQEPGSAGKFVIESYTKSLAGYNFAGDRPTGEKTARWGPFASQARGGNVYYLKAPWNEAFLSEVGEAPFGDFKDQVDAAAGAYSEITLRKPFAFA